MTDIPLTENTRRVLEARYLLRDEGGVLRETLEELFHERLTALETTSG